MKKIDEIIVLFKTHLDIGYTDFAENIKVNYLNSYIPKALAVARELKDMGRDERFIWTTGSWLIEEYLNTTVGSKREEMIDAITSGDISWHGLPFTTHTELMDTGLFCYALSLSKSLDERFSRKTIAAKLTDVPGHTRSIIPYLADAGIEFLHIGVNPVSVSPSIPMLFRWCSPEGKEITVMYNAGYGSYTEIPGTNKALLFAHTGDNMGPQSAESIIKTYESLKEKYPGAKIKAGDLNDIALAVREIRSQLPMVTDEIGDTWIHGVQTDPKKVSQYRELLRLRKNWSNENQRKINYHLLQIPEHTWGLDFKANLKDHNCYVRSDFEKARESEPYQKMEQSWHEQRKYIDLAVNSVDGEMRDQAKAAINDYQRNQTDLRQYNKVEDMFKIIKKNGCTIGFNRDGAISYLNVNGKMIADLDHIIGVFRYDAYSRKEIDQFFSQYVDLETFPELKDLAIDDFNKLGEEAAIQEFLTCGVEFKGLYEKGDEIVAKLKINSTATKLYGCPTDLELRVVLKEDKVLLDFAWWNKPASRVAEAMWLAMNPIAEHCMVSKLDTWIDPLSVVKYGNKRLHSTDWGVRFDTLSIETLDTALVNIGNPSLYDFNDDQPDLTKGVYFNLYNNMWNTNFPLWYGEDSRFRFLIRV